MTVHIWCSFARLLSAPSRGLLRVLRGSGQQLFLVVILLACARLSKCSPTAYVSMSEASTCVIDAFNPSGMTCWPYASDFVFTTIEGAVAASSPPALPRLATAPAPVFLSAGGVTTCTVRSDHSLLCWCDETDDKLLEGGSYDYYYYQIGWTNVTFAGLVPLNRSSPLCSGQWALDPATNASYIQDNPNYMHISASGHWSSDGLGWIGGPLSASAAVAPVSNVSASGYSFVLLLTAYEWRNLTAWYWNELLLEDTNYDLGYYDLSSLGLEDDTPTFVGPGQLQAAGLCVLSYPDSLLSCSGVDLSQPLYTTMDCLEPSIVLSSAHSSPPSLRVVRVDPIIRNTPWLQICASSFATFTAQQVGTTLQNYIMCGIARDTGRLLCWFAYPTDDDYSYGDVLLYPYSPPSFLSFSSMSCSNTGQICAVLSTPSVKGRLLCFDTFASPIASVSFSVLAHSYQSALADVLASIDSYWLPSLSDSWQSDGELHRVCSAAEGDLPLNGALVNLTYTAALRVVARAWLSFAAPPHIYWHLVAERLRQHVCRCPGIWDYRRARLPVRAGSVDG